MRLCCITVCVDYANYLDSAAFWNTGQFDEHAVVTIPGDVATRSVCAAYGLRPILTSSFYSNGDTFNKARAINVALRTIKPDDWVLFMDADIILPLDFREQLEKLTLDPENLYYTKRKPLPESTDGELLCRLKIEKDLWGSVKDGHPGFDCQPWGYFQLVNAQCPRLKKRGTSWMEERFKSAADYDTEFKSRWPVRQHVKLPEDKFTTLHLWHGHRGKNWRGLVPERRATDAPDGKKKTVVYLSGDELASIARGRKAAFNNQTIFIRKDDADV